MAIEFRRPNQHGLIHRKLPFLKAKTPDANSIRRYSEEQMTKNIYFAHREPKDFSDRIALFMVRMLRWGTDLATRYKHDVE